MNFQLPLPRTSEDQRLPRWRQALGRYTYWPSGVILLLEQNEITSHTCLPAFFKNLCVNCSSIPLLETVSGYYSSVPPQPASLSTPFEQAATPNTFMRGSAMQRKCGYPIEKWNDAKRQVKAVLIERAKAGDIISYLELAVRVTAIKLEPQSFALTTMLREIAAEESAAGRGMLTALVVYSSGDMQPGPGFFDLAGRLGKNTNDILRCWIKELKRVHGYWSRVRLSESKRT